MNRSILKSTFSLLNTDHVQLNKNWNYKNVTSTFYRLYYIDGGEGKLYNTTDELRLEEGYLYLIPSFTTCNYYCDNYLSQYYVTFSEESADGSSLFSSNRKLFKIKAAEADIICFEKVLQLNPNRSLLHVSYNPAVYEKRPVLKTFTELNEFMHVSAYVETYGILLQLISRFLKPEHFFVEDNSVIHSKISDAINYIQTNLQSVITVADLAKRANHNPDYFSRLFYENTGERPLTYIQSKRIERAQLLLTTTNMPFYEIATETGFENLSYFSRIFKNITGQTPSSYKKHSLVI
ncbi:helix-turn-helix transcriptional regulator [Mucilaginibacter sabulilitoris]|uniref:Helix-turn-helix transcriptional regulator n=1 Tax=Mucilaginibacter sabulilitoris TaxID=1173583 RepID=A0ABZ0TGF8_9SPHI|nr:helix-turn-helix transcriptional regulator [Mucilaginibacter sabulilitoris]WPU92276.1 helix-turn-helix transcriptional regulator [Mucilaginibacter sabulilitoris]